MKKIFFGFTSLFSLVLVKGQDKIFKLGVGPGLYFPSGHFGDGANIGTGFEFRGNEEMTDNFRIFSQTGFQYFFSSNEFSPSYSFIPVLIGADFVHGGLITGLGLGYGNYLRSKYIINFGYYGAVANSAVLGGFTYSPEFGYTSPSIDLLVNFSNTSLNGVSFSHFGIKAYFKFFSTER